MNALDRADALLTKSQGRRGIVTPNNMESPMDAATTQQITRERMQRMVGGNDPNVTQRLPHDDASDVTQDLSGGKKDSGVVKEPEVEVEEIDGLIPTTKQRTKSSVSDHLDG